jgi:prevent-host-death family protein
MKVGTKELKNRLSEYLAHVKRGEVVHVTAHGKVVAEIRPVAEDKNRDEAAAQELAAEGAVTRARGRLSDFEPVQPRRRAQVSAWIVDDRR